MTIRTPVTAFSCDAEGCGITELVDGHPATLTPLPIGWWRLESREPAEAPFVFCSRTCLHRWAGAASADICTASRHRHRTGCPPLTCTLDAGHGGWHKTATGITWNTPPNSRGRDDTTDASS